MVQPSDSCSFAGVNSCDPQDVAGTRHKSMSPSTAYWSIAAISLGVNSRCSSAATFAQAEPRCWLRSAQR